MARRLDFRRSIRSDCKSIEFLVSLMNQNGFVVVVIILSKVSLVLP